VECRSSGSRPDAVITWWKANKPIIKEIKNVSSLYIAYKLCDKKMLYSEMKIDIILKKVTSFKMRKEEQTFLIKSSSLGLFI